MNIKQIKQRIKSAIFSTRVATLQMEATPNYLTPVFVDNYIGTRLNPLPEYNGFEVNKSINQNVGYRAVNTDDTGNGALAGFTAKGSGPLYTNGTTMNHFGASYFIPYFAGNGSVLSNKKLLLGTTGGSDLEFFTGTATSNVTSKLIVKNNGQLEIPIEPTNNNAGKLIGRLPDGKIVTTPIAVVFNSIAKLTLAELNAQYPNVQIGFSVQNFNATDISLFIKSVDGWITQTFTEVV